MESDEAKGAAAAAKEATAARRAFYLALVAAVAGIVGAVVGAGSSWLISREDRNSQRASAREARAYGRKANAYLDALALFQPIEEPLARRVQVGVERGGRIVKRPPEPRYPSRKVIHVELARLDKADSRLRLTLLAFASVPANAAYENAWSSAQKALLDADEVWDFFPPGLDTKPDVALSEQRLSTGSRADFLKAQSRYQRHVHAFLVAFASFLEATRHDIGSS
jgi:hypothetical protein